MDVEKASETFASTK